MKRKRQVRGHTLRSSTMLFKGWFPPNDLECWWRKGDLLGLSASSGRDESGS